MEDGELVGTSSRSSAYRLRRHTIQTNPHFAEALEVIQTDNGVEFGASFHWHVLDKGIGHVYIKPRTPRLNGKVERLHRIDAEEFSRLLEGVVIDDAKVFNDKLQEWEDFYNYHRPHGSLGGQTPMRDSSSAPRPGV